MPKIQITEFNARFQICGAHIFVTKKTYLGNKNTIKKTRCQIKNVKNLIKILKNFLLYDVGINDIRFSIANFEALPG